MVLKKVLSIFVVLQNIAIPELTQRNEITSRNLLLGIRNHCSPHFVRGDSWSTPHAARNEALLYEEQVNLCCHFKNLFLHLTD